MLPYDPLGVHPRHDLAVRAWRSLGSGWAHKISMFWVRRFTEWPDPQGPCHTNKYYGHSNSLRWWLNTTMVAKHYGKVSETPYFLGNIFRAFFKGGGTLTRRNEIRVTPGMTVRWHSAPARRHCTVMRLSHRFLSSLNKEGDVALAWRSWSSRHHCGQTLYLSPGCGIPPPLPLPTPPPPLKSPGILQEISTKSELLRWQ